MPAPFVAELCGHREGRPNTSDRNDPQSVELGHALFARIGVARHRPEPEGIGAMVEDKIVNDLRARRPDLVIERGRSAFLYEQYRHLASAAKQKRGAQGPEPLLALLDELLASIPEGPSRVPLERKIARARDDLDLSAALLEELLERVPNEAVLKIDVAVSGSEPPGELEVALSSKWTLRTDRAQDCISQGNKLVSLRRGRMPHFAVITMEPRPAMLRLLADGSGSIDCVYHLDLPSLRMAVVDLEASRATKRGRVMSWGPRETLERLIRQGRLRDYDDLVREVQRLPIQDTSGH
jgi:NgoMIV restriction enzyme